MTIRLFQKSLNFIKKKNLHVFPLSALSSPHFKYFQNNSSFFDNIFFLYFIIFCVGPKMGYNNLVRDFAIHIASSEEYGFMVKAGIGLKEWPMSINSIEACTTISLMGKKLTELPERLECPQLKVLLLEVDHGLNVPERFFEGMREIEVLSLNGGRLSLQSLELSTNFNRWC